MTTGRCGSSGGEVRTGRWWSTEQWRRSENREVGSSGGKVSRYTSIICNYCVVFKSGQCVVQVYIMYIDPRLSGSPRDVSCIDPQPVGRGSIPIWTRLA